MVASNLIPAAVYYRMSSDQQAESIVSQRPPVESMATAEGYQVVAEYVDEARPGWKEDRKDFQRLIADAQAGKFKAVLCWDQDRFSRFPVLEANHYWYVLDKAGVHIRTVNQGRLDFATLAGWLTASLAQHGKSEYCRDIAKNCGRGLKKRKLAGEWVGKAPYGYKIGSDGHLIIGDAAEIAAVRLIFNMRAQGHGVWSIAKHLNSTAVATPRGRQWSTKAVQHVLQREAYIGMVVIGKWSRAKYQPLTDGIVEVAGAHPALIDRPTWDAVQVMWHEKRQAHWKGNANNGGALAGLLVCGNCGGPMYHCKHNAQPNSTHYLCGARQRTGECSCNRVNAGRMLELVARKIREHVLLDSPQRLAAAIGRRLAARKAATIQVDASPIQKQLAAIDAKIENAMDRLITVATSLVAPIERKLLDLQRQREALAGRLIAPKAVPELDPEAIAAELWKLDDLIRTGSPGDVRRALSKIIREIRIDFEYVTTTGRGERWRPIGGVMELVTEGSGPGRLSLVCASRVKLTREDFTAKAA